MPPVSDEDGRLYFEQLPGYTVEVLGILEECNLKIARIKELMEEGVPDESDEES